MTTATSSSDGPASDEHLSLALEAAEMGTWEWNIGEGRVFWSAALERMHGLAEGSFPGTFEAYQRDIHPDDRDHVLSTIERTVRDRQPHRLEYRIVLPEGQVRWLQARGRLLLDEQGQPARLIGVCMDITAHRERDAAWTEAQAWRRHAEEELAEQTRLALLSRDVGLALTRILDKHEMLQRCAQAVVDHIGAAFARVWTFNDAEQVLELRASAGMYTHLDGPHGRVPAGKFKIGRIAAERKAHLTNEVQADPLVGDPEWAKREGMVAFAGYPLVFGGRLIGVLAMFAPRALSDADFKALETVANAISVGVVRARTDAAIRESEDRYRRRAQELTTIAAELEYQRDLTTTIMNNTASALFMMNDQGHPVFLNSAACAMTGYRSLEEIKDRPLHDAVHFRKPDGSPYPMEECPIDRANAEIVPLRALREVFCRKDGTLFPVECNVAPVERAGKIAGAVLEVRDITDDVAAEQALRRHAHEMASLAAALHRSNQDLDQFAYVASHDLKAPLRGIANLSQWLEEDLGDSVIPSARGHLALLRNRVHRMEALIDGILEYSRAGRASAPAERVAVRRLIGDVVDLLQPPAHVQIDLPDDLPVLNTERMPLQQVFLNLIGNALKHAGSVEAPRLTISWRREADGHAFLVADNGPGIAPAFHERIWGIFQTLQPRDKVEGTGIGLTLVKKIVETRGGRVWIDSSEGAGATFGFTWPAPGREPV